jgi:selenium-binding protein 1
MEASCCHKAQGPGYATPMEAFRSRTREKLIYVPCIPTGENAENREGYLATVDVDPQSPTFCKIIYRTMTGNKGDELHHTGWNACSSCHSDTTGTKARNHLVMPAVFSGNFYFVDTATNPRAPKLDKVVSGKEVIEKTGLSYPHSAHCLANGDIMVSMMGNAEGNGEGGFVLLDTKFNVSGRWEEAPTPFGYDFWYQPRINAMVSSGFGEPNAFKTGFNPQHINEGKYGSKLYFWDWQEHKLIQTIDLGSDGAIPLEVRFLHEPTKAEGFVGVALSSTVFRFFKGDDGKWQANKVIAVDPVQVEGWVLPNMPGLLTDIILSLDDKYLYLSNWLHGDIRQYDVSDTSNPKLVGQVFLGGSIRQGGPVKVLRGGKEVKVPKVQGHTLQGGPQMLQLSLDGRRLYVTNSLLSVWDKQFYPDMARSGSYMLQIDVDTDRGGLSINNNFYVDFGVEPDGPVLAHEMRYPGGDCTSDIWV